MKNPTIFSRLAIARPEALCLMLLLLIPVASAEIYQWRDASGRVHFSDEPPASQSYDEVELQGGTEYTPVPEHTRGLVRQPSGSSSSGAGSSSSSESAASKRAQRAAAVAAEQRAEAQRQAACERYRERYRKVSKVISSSSMEAQRKRRDKKNRLRQLIKDTCH